MDYKTDRHSSSEQQSLLARRKQQIVAISMAAIERRIDQLLAIGAAQHEPAAAAPPRRRPKRTRDDVVAASSPGGGDEHGGSGSRSDSEDGRGVRGSKQKRIKHEKCAGDRDGDHHRSKTGKSGDTTTKEGPRYACPFCKHDPKRYKTVKTCCGPGWRDPHRVKEHLYRSHCLKNTCPRCYESFEDARGLKEHQRAEKSCRLKSAPKDVITDEQEKQLRARSKAGLSGDEKWAEMYRILFPGSKIPSPYYESSSSKEDTFDEDIDDEEDDDDVVRDEEEEAKKFAKATSQSSHKDLDDFRHHVKTELKRVIKPILEVEVERALQTVQKSVVHKANALVNEISLKFFRTWNFQHEQAAAAGYVGGEPALELGPMPTASGGRQRAPSPPPPAPAPALAPPKVFEEFMENIGGDSLFPYLVPGGDFDWNSFMSPAGFDLNGGGQGAHQGLVDCGTSLPDSAYFGSGDMSSLTYTGAWE